MTLTREQREKNAVLRMMVYANLDKYLGEGEMNPISLSILLGYNDKEWDTMKDNFSDRDVELCRALAGPHGYTVYKMLLIRKADQCES